MDMREVGTSFSLLKKVFLMISSSNIPRPCGPAWIWNYC